MWALALLALVGGPGCGGPSLDDAGVVDTGTADARDVGSPIDAPMDVAPLDAPGADSSMFDGGSTDAAEIDGGFDAGGLVDSGPDDVGTDAGSDAGRRCVVPTDYATIGLALDDVTCDRIDVLPGTYFENVTIARSVAIVGAGAIIDGSDAGSVLVVQAGAVVHLEGLTIQHGSAPMGGGVQSAGNLTMLDVVVTANTATGPGATGAGIRNTGTLTLRRSRVEMNTIDLVGSLATGGGITSAGGAVSLLEGSVVRGNRVHVVTGPSTTAPAASGGGVYMDDAMLVLEDASIDDNEVSCEGADSGAQAQGGGVWMRRGTLELRGASDISTNRALATSNNGGTAAGGGIHATLGDVRIREGSAVRDNQARGESSGAIDVATASGAGIQTIGGQLTIDAGHVDGNSATARTTMGGGIRATGSGLLTVRAASTLSDNHLIAPGGSTNPTAQGAGLSASSGVTLTIEGASAVEGNTITITAHGGFASSGGAGLALDGVTAAIIDSTIVGNSADVTGATGSGGSLHEGGGMRANTGTLNLDGATVAMNRAVLTGPGSAGCNGGGVSTSAASVIASGSSLTDNRCEATGSSGVTSGGGIASVGGQVTLTETTVAGNVAQMNGSGINHNSAGGGVSFLVRSAAGSLTLIRSTISDNEAQGSWMSWGGGVMVEASINQPATVEIEQCTISGNAASMANRGGGGIRLVGRTTAVVTALMSNTTVTGNVTQIGGGIYVDSGATLEVRNSIVYGNTGNMGPDCHTQTGVTLVSVGYDIFGTRAGCVIGGPQTGDRNGMDPMLAPLADNGGPTFTHLIGATSAAHDAGDPAGCADPDGVLFSIDQRGLPRAVGRCDIGSVELAP